MGEFRMNLKVLQSHIEGGLRHHMEDAKTWPGSFVVWQNPIPWRTQVLLILGYLHTGNSKSGCTAVHITSEGREILNGLKEN